MGVRRRGREYALQMLYAMDLTGYAPDQVFAGFYAIQDLNRDAFYYARRLVDGVHGQMEEIDGVLTKYAEHIAKRLMPKSRSTPRTGRSPAWPPWTGTSSAWASTSSCS